MLKIYNTLSKEKEEFRPIKKGNISMYVCGPTVYDYCHLGHAKGYISMDVIRRYLEWSGYKVKYIQNFTDVGHLTDDADQGEDKIEKRANEKKIDPIALADQYVNLCVEDFESLSIKKPDQAPRPTKFIKEMIEFAQQLIEKGYAYEVNGSVYFDVTKFKEYGKLSGGRIEEMLAGARVEIRDEKKNPFDFALWIKAEPEHILKWDSPWSVGYPGWHIECSVMSRTYLGDTFDIHGGGNENIFPHNENEIAQSEALTGKQMANYWLHWGMVQIEGTKMSKSKGNFTTVRQLLKDHDASVLRLGVIKSHYRSPMDFNERMFEESKKNLEEFRTILKKLGLIETKDKNDIDIDAQIKETRDGFIEAMNDDFNTPVALSKLFQFVNTINKEISNIDVGQAKKVISLFHDIGSVLGLGLDRVETAELSKELQKLIDEREEARKNSDFKKADEIREELRKKGIEVEDAKDGVRWRKTD